MGDKEFHTFPKGIRAKVNIIARLEFELAYFEVTVKLLRHFNHYPYFNEIVVLLK